MAGTSRTRTVEFEVRTEGAREAEVLVERLAPLGEVSARRLFGGYGLYVDETIFGIVHERRLYFKTDDLSRPTYEQRGSGPLRVDRGAKTLGYYEVPLEIEEHDDELRSWARRAVVAAQQKGAAHVCPPEQILQGVSPALCAVVQQLRALVLDVVPTATEAGYPGWKLIGYRAPAYFCFIAPLADHVRLGFERGHELQGTLLEGDHLRQVRYVRLLPGQAIPASELRALITQAVELPARTKRQAPAPRKPAGSGPRSRAASRK